MRNRKWCAEKCKLVMMALEYTMGAAPPNVKNKAHTGDEQEARNGAQN